MPELPEELKRVPERKAGQEPTASLTLEAYTRLKTELDELVTNGRERIAERLKVAREHGDIRENAEYDAAKDAQGLMEAQIRRLQEALRDPEIIEAPMAADAHRAAHARHRPVARRRATTRRPTSWPSTARRRRRVRARSRPRLLRDGLIGASKDQEVLVQAPGGSFRYVVVGFEPFVG